METVQEGGGRLQNSSAVTKTPNRLKIVESDEDDKVTSEKVVEMDPYRELELYLAKVNKTTASGIVATMQAKFSFGAVQNYL